MPRPARLLISVCTAALLTLGATACTTEVTAAAVVGDAQISAADLDSRIQSVTAEVDQQVEDVNLIDLQRQDLNSRIRHELLVELGLMQTVDEATLLALPDQLGGQQTVAGQLGAFNNDELLAGLQDLASQMALVSTAAQNQTLVATPTITFDYVSATSFVEAVNLKSQYEKDPEALTAAAGIAQDQGGIGLQATPTTNGDLVATGLFSAKTGQILVLSLGTANLVLRVTNAETVPAPIDLASLQQAGVPGIRAAAGLILAGMAAGVPVEINPRFGVWDAVTMHVTNELGRR